MSCFINLTSQLCDRELHFLISRGVVVQLWCAVVRDSLLRRGHATASRHPPCMGRDPLRSTCRCRCGSCSDQSELQPPKSLQNRSNGQSRAHISSTVRMAPNSSSEASHINCHRTPRIIRKWIRWQIWTACVTSCSSVNSIPMSFGCPTSIQRKIIQPV
jgi:hypothetical protein